VDHPEVNDQTTTQLLFDPEPVSSATNWSYVDPTTKHRCVIVQMNISLSLGYNNNGSMETYNMTFPQESRSISGNCGEDFQNLTVVTEPANVTFGFLRFKEKYNLYRIFFDVKVPEHRDEHLILDNGTIFGTLVQRSFRCKGPIWIMKSPFVNISVTNVQLEAFRTREDYLFGSPRDCSDVFSDMVLVVAGIALMISIVAVISVYCAFTGCKVAKNYNLLEEDGVSQRREPEIEVGAPRIVGGQENE